MMDENTNDEKVDGSCERYVWMKADVLCLIEELQAVESEKLSR